MNEVDHLLNNPFSSMSFEDKLEIKRLGPHRPHVIQITQTAKRQNRKFCVSWFEKKVWLTASVAKNLLFCFPCLLSGGDTAWTQQGIVDLKHLSDKIKKHESRTSHIGNSVKLSMLGKVKAIVRNFYVSVNICFTQATTRGDDTMLINYFSVFVLFVLGVLGQHSRAGAQEMTRSTRFYLTTRREGGGERC